MNDTDIYIINEMNTTRIMYDRLISDDAYIFDKKENTLFINPSADEFSELLKYLKIDRKDVSEYSKLENILMSKLWK